MPLSVSPLAYKKESMMGCLSRWNPLLSFLLLLGAAPSASAGPITLNYTAVVNNSFLPGLVAGDLLSGSFTYDSVGVDLFPLDPNHSQYSLDPSFAFSIFSAAYSFQGSSFTMTTRQVFNDSLNGIEYHDFFSAGGQTPLVATQTAGYQLDSVGVSFTGPDVTSPPAPPLGSDAIPTTLNLADWDRAGISFIVLGDDGGFFKVSASLTSLEPATSVPEPTTLLLLSTALGVGTVTRKRFRKFNPK